MIFYISADQYITSGVGSRYAATMTINTIQSASYATTEIPAFQPRLKPNEMAGVKRTNAYDNMAASIARMKVISPPPPDMIANNKNIAPDSTETPNTPAKAMP